MFWVLILACRATELDADGGDKHTGGAEELDSNASDGGSDSGPGRDSGDSGERDSGGDDSGIGADSGDDSGEALGADTADESGSDSGHDSAEGNEQDSGATDEIDTAGPGDTGEPVDTDPVADTGASPADTGPMADTGASPADTGPVAETGTPGRDTSTRVHTGVVDSDSAGDSPGDSPGDSAVESDPTADTASDSAASGDTADTATDEETSACVGEVVACEEPDDPSADDDGDGITDDCDYCPATPSGVTVNDGGCACEGSDTFLVAPGAGNNDGTDIGSVTRAMDTFVSGTSTGGWTSTNYGDATYLACAYGYPTGTNRCFLRFELSAIPEDASIDAGTLTLYAYDFSGHGSSYGSAGSRDFYASPVTAEWEEMSMTGLDQPAVDSAETSAAAYCAYSDRSPCELEVTTILDYLRANGNYGFRVDDGGVHAFTRYHTASDDSFTELAPSLEITYTVP